MTSWGIRREPFEPLFIHAGEVILVREHDCSADDFVQGAAGFLKDRLYIRQLLRSLFLNGRALYSACVWISRGRTRDEYQPGSLDRLAVRRWRLSRLWREHNLTGHFCFLPVRIQGKAIFWGQTGVRNRRRGDKMWGARA